MLKVAIAGLGTVGAGVVRLLRQNADLIAARAGKPIVLKAVSARDKNRKRDCDLPGVAWAEDPSKLAQLDVDVVVELIGGSEGIARAVAENTLKSGKHLVTANKALIAVHGLALAKLAEQNKLHLAFEAAVAGGIPIIKALREGLAGNKIRTVYGILNGTCNFILTRMREGGLSFDLALSEAQQRGYAEANPSSDIDGEDSAQKLAILTALAFGVEPDLSSVQLDGIRNIRPVDLLFAEELDCRVKLLGVARSSIAGIEQRVGPALVPLSSTLSQINGPLNAVQLRGDFSGNIMLEGQGAGSDPTASSVVADLIDLARGHVTPAFGVPAAELKKGMSAHVEHEVRHYMRIQVMDKPGVVADISAVLRDEAISIESLLQRGKSVTESVPVVITTHAVNAGSMRKAVEKIARLSTVVEKPCLMQIED